MAELIPERRTDKNGVTSTKWVKPVEKAPTRNWAPPPTLKEITARRELIEHLSVEMNRSAHNDDDEYLEGCKRFSGVLSGYSDDVISGVKEFWEKESREYNSLAGLHWVLFSMVDTGANGETVRDLLIQLPMGEHKDSIISYSEYRQRGWIDWEVTAKDDPRMTALDRTAMTIAESLGTLRLPRSKQAEDNWGVPMIDNPELFFLVLDRLEQNDRIRSIIQERRTTDIAVILMELDDQTPALSKGNL